MKFFSLCWLAVEWKNLVLKSPCCIHKVLDPCHHMSFPLSCNSFISLRRRAISSVKSWRVSSDSRCCSCSCFFFSCISIWPNTFLFHYCSCCWQFMIQSCVVKFWCYLVASQASSTTSLQPRTQSHIDSKQKRGFFLCYICSVFRYSIKAQWYDVAMDL